MQKITRLNLKKELQKILRKVVDLDCPVEAKKVVLLILQAQMNNYIILTPIIPRLNVTKAAEVRHKHRNRTLFITPQKI